MNPQTICCPIANCPARGQFGQGNIKIHDQQKQRYRCKVCGHAFSKTKGTPFYRLHHQRDVFTTVILYIVQVVKQYVIGHVAGVERRLVQGRAAQVEAALHKVLGGGVFNTAFIERINATLRGHIAALTRRGRALALRSQTLHHALYVTGAVYNFCTEHAALQLPGLIGGHKYLGRTPAMAAGLADQCWTVEELLVYRVPLPRWQPPKKRGRPSREMLALIAKWAL